MNHVSVPLAGVLIRMYENADAEGREKLKTILEDLKKRIEDAGTKTA